MHKRHGFTAIELVIAMIVIGVLLTISVISLRSAQMAARDREREADVTTIKNYLESIYPREIKNSSGRVVKQAGTYPALPQEVGDTMADLELVFADLDPDAMTAPGISSKRKTPSVPGGGDYIPSQPYMKICSDYMLCYERPNSVKGSKNEYIYAPGPARNELCTSENANRIPSGSNTDKCRMYQIIYRTEAGDERVVVESKRR